MPLARQRLFVFLIPLFLVLPFLNRAYFVDDSYFVEIATWLKDNPTLPYHFRADDAGPQNRGWEEDGFVRMVNPLAHHYYLALLLKLGGEREWFLRLGCVLLSCFSALFLFEFARRWTNTPVLSVLAVLFTPAMWLSSYSLLIDSTMAFFAFGAVYFFIRSTETDKFWQIVASGVFAGLAILSKYPAVFVLALMSVWLALRWKKLDRHWRFFVPVVIALGFLAAYSAWTAHLYGSPHILAASARMVRVFGWPKLFAFFVFLSGALLLPLVAWGVSPLRTRLMAFVPVILLTIFLSSKFGGFSMVQAALLGIWIVTSFLFIGQILHRKPEWIYPRDPFLVFWFLGFVGMMLLVMDWVAGRYFCLVAPAVGFLTVRLVEMRWRENSPRVLMPILAVLFLFTGALATSDYRQAEPVRSLRRELAARHISGGERHFYLGDSFTMSYLKRDGWTPLFPETTLRVGDLVLVKEVTMPLIWFARKPVTVREITHFEYPSLLPLKVMDFAGSAGFYASVWGALPFTFSNGPWERFRIVEVVEVHSDIAH